MIVAAFRNRVKPELMSEYVALAGEMAAIAMSMPEFISFKNFVSEDGEAVSVHEWDSAEYLRAWRQHPEHLKVQGRGRREFYQDYVLYVCDNPRISRFTADG